MLKYTITIALALLASLPAWCKQTPLTAIVLDGATVIRDGKTPNTITIGIYNYNTPSTSRADDNAYTIKKGESILIRFIIDPGKGNEEPKRPWALTTADWYSQVRVQAYFDENKQIDSRWECSNEDKYVGNTYRSYTITAKEDVLIKPGQFVKVVISGLITKLPDGPTQAYILYEPTQHPPGEYNELNSSFGTIQKSPLFIQDNKVGIGTNQTNAADFNVNGGMRAAGGALQPGKDNNIGYSFNNGDGSTGIASRKDGQVGVYTNGFEAASVEKEKEAVSMTLNGELWVKSGVVKKKQVATTLEPNKSYAISDGKQAWDVGNGDLNYIKLFSLHGGVQQHFGFSDAGNGYFKIYSMFQKGDQFLAWNGQKFGYGSSPKAQAFKPIPNGDGTFKFEIKGMPGEYLAIDLGKAPKTDSRTNLYIIPSSNSAPNYNLLDGEVTTYMKFGEKENYQYKEMPGGTYNQPTLALDAPNGTSIGFYNGQNANLEINSTNGDMHVRRNANIGGSADIAGNTQVRHNLTVSGATQSDGNLNVNGKVTLKGNAPIIYKTFYTGRLTDNYSDRYKTLDTGISKNDYVGTIAGYKIEYYDARDDDKGRFAMRIIDDGGSNLKLEVRIYADQPVDQVVVNALFFRKEMVEFR